MTPAFQPLFLNLHALPLQEILSEAGYFGGILRLMREGRSDELTFRSIMQEVLVWIEAMQPTERFRWQEFLNYLHALVYHARDRQEHEALQELIVESSREHDEGELTMAWQSAAQADRERAAITILQKTLSRVLQTRFGEIPEVVRSRIENTNELPKLEEWMNQFALAKSLDEIDFEPAKKKKKR